MNDTYLEIEPSDACSEECVHCLVALPFAEVEIKSSSHSSCGF